MRLTPVDPKSFDDLGFLYSVLGMRMDEPWTNISHTIMPAWHDHATFIEGRPYAEHYIMRDHRLCVGVCYISLSDEVGIWVHPGMRRHGYAKQALQFLQRQRSYLRANINPKNEGSVKFFEAHHFVRIYPCTTPQYIYEWRKAWPDGATQTSNSSKPSSRKARPAPR